MRTFRLQATPPSVYTGGMLKKLIYGLVLAAIVSPAMAAVDWMTDLEAAKSKAAAENKALLLDFTGSDWCGWCIRIRREVFDKPRFAAYVKDKFIPVEIDVPNNPNFDKELRRRNEELCQQYAVEGFPTIMVTDAQGTVAGGFVGGIVDPAAVEAILNEGLNNVRKLEEAQKLSGVQKAQVLAEVYKSLPEDLVGAATPLLKEIKALDPQDTVGLNKLAQAREQKENFLRGLAEINSEEQLSTYLEKALAEAFPENRPMMLQLKGQLMINQAKTEADILAARDVLLESVGNDAAMRTKLEQYFSNPAELLKRTKARRNNRRNNSGK